MRIENTRDIRALQIGSAVIALGLFCAPWMFEFVSQSVAAWSAWTLSACYLAVGAASSPRSIGFTATALLALGLWTLLAPGILNFDLSNPSAFWTHTISGLLALGGSYIAFQDIDQGGMRMN